MIRSELKEHLQNQHDYHLRSDKEEDSEVNEDFVEMSDELDEYDLRRTAQLEVVLFFIYFLTIENYVCNISYLSRIFQWNYFFVV